MEWKLLKVEKREGVVTVVIDNPPINLITLDLFRELSQLSLIHISEPTRPY